jgi:hypothetical protein
MDKKIKLDIGSGRAHFEDYITVDKDPSVGADICVDVEDDFGDLAYDSFLQDFENKCDEVRAHHILEHFRPESKIMMMALFWDLLKPGGILDIEVPLFPHSASVQDPTHLSFWTAESFWYFERENKFGEAFAKRYSEYPVPLFEKVEDWYKGEKPNCWAYGIKLKK